MIKWIGEKIEQFKTTFRSEVVIERINEKLGIGGEEVTARKDLLYVKYQKSEDSVSPYVHIVCGERIEITDTADNNTGAVVMLGSEVFLDSFNNDGTVVQQGYSAFLTDGDTGSGSSSIGYFSSVEDGGVDFKAVSTADGGDYFTIATTTHGATTLTTVDDDATAAHFEIAADGNITLDAAGNIALEADTTITGTRLTLDHATRNDIKFTNTGDEDHYIRKDGDFLRFRGHDDSTVILELKNNTNGSNAASFPNGTLDIGGALTCASRTFAAVGGTPGAHDGDVVYFGSTTSMSVGKIYMFQSTGAWVLADADAVATSDALLGVALGAASDTNGMLLRGMVSLDHDPGAIGDVLFLHTTAGECNATAPSDTGDIVRVIGYQIDADDEIWFNPDGTFVEVA